MCLGYSAFTVGKLSQPKQQQQFWFGGSSREGIKWIEEQRQVKKHRAGLSRGVRLTRPNLRPRVTGGNAQGNWNEESTGRKAVWAISAPVACLAGAHLVLLAQPTRGTDER